MSTDSRFSENFCYKSDRVIAIIMTEAGRKKRRAEEQLSPYSQEPTEAAAEEPAEAVPDSPLPRRARARRNRDAIPRGNFKGMFGKVSLTEGEKAATKAPDTDDLIAGVNRSFLDALTRVIDKQANKDLTYLFRQYEKFMNDIRENSQNK